MAHPIVGALRIFTLNIILQFRVKCNLWLHYINGSLRAPISDISEDGVSCTGVVLIAYLFIIQLLYQYLWYSCKNAHDFCYEMYFKFEI